MPCCGRQTQQGSVVFLHGSNFTEITSELNKRLGSHAAILSTKQRYLPGYTVPLTCLYPKSAVERGVAVSNAANHVAQDKVAVIQVHDDPFQRIPHHANNSLLAGSNFFAGSVPRVSVLAYSPLGEVIKSSSNPSQLMTDVRDYGFRYTGSPTQTANSLEWLTLKHLKKNMAALHTALGGTDDALVQTQLLQKHLTRTLGLHGEGENGVYVVPRNPYDLTVNTNSPAKAAKDIIKTVNSTARAIRPTTLSTIGGSAFFGEHPPHCSACSRTKNRSDTLCGTCLQVAGDFLDAMQQVQLSGSNMQSADFQFADNGGLVEQVKPQAEACAGNVVLVLDGSASLGQSGWDEQIRFAKKFVERASGWMSGGNMQIGAVVYEAKPEPSQVIGLNSNGQQTLADLAKLKYPRTLSQLNTGLNAAKKMLDAVQGGKAVMLLSDGDATNTEQALSAANSVKQSSIKIFGVGTGNADENQLKALVSAPAAENMTMVDDNAGLTKVAEAITQYCPVAAMKLDCVVSDFDDWGECSDPCGGTARRARKVYAEATTGTPCSAVPLKDSRSCEVARECKPNPPQLLPDECIPARGTDVLPKLEKVKLQFDSIVWVNPNGIAVRDGDGKVVAVPNGAHPCVAGNGSKSVYIDLLDGLFSELNLASGKVRVTVRANGVKDYVPWAFPEEAHVSVLIVPPAGKVTFNPPVAGIAGGTPVELAAPNAQFMCYTTDGTDPDCGDGEEPACNAGTLLDGEVGYTENIGSPDNKDSTGTELRVQSCSRGGHQAIQKKDYYPVFDKPEGVRQCRLVDGNIRNGFFYDADANELIADSKAGNDQSTHPNRYGRYYLRGSSRNTGSGNTCYLAPEDFVVDGVSIVDVNGHALTDEDGNAKPLMVARNRKVDFKVKLDNGMKAINGPLALRVRPVDQFSDQFTVTPAEIAVRAGKSVTGVVSIRAHGDAAMEDDIPLIVEVEKKANNLNNVDYPANQENFVVNDAIGVSGQIAGIEVLGGRVQVPAGGMDPTPVQFSLIGPVVQGGPITLTPTAPNLTFQPEKMTINPGEFATAAQGEGVVGFTVLADQNAKLGPMPAGAGGVTVKVTKEATNTNTWAKLDWGVKGFQICGWVTDIKCYKTSVPIASTGCCQIKLQLEGIALKTHGDAKMKLQDPRGKLEFQPDVVLFPKGKEFSERITVNVKPDCPLGEQVILAALIPDQPAANLFLSETVEINEITVIKPMPPMGEMEEWSYKRILSKPRSYPEQWTSFYGNTGLEAQSPCPVSKKKSTVRTDAKLKPMYLIRPQPMKGRELSFKNFGNTMKLDMSKSEIHMKGHYLEDGPYYMENIHFHTPGEHEINGKIFDAEMIAEFSIKSGERVYLFFPLQVGAANAWLDPIFEAMYRVQCRGGETSITTFEWDYYTLNHEYLDWEAAPTMPPFSNKVRYIMDTKFESISRAQLNILSQAIRKNNNKHGNNRPLQPFEPEVKLARYPGGMNQAVMNSLNLEAARAPEDLFAASDLENAAKALGLSVNSTDPDMFPSIFSDVPDPWREGWKEKWTEEQHAAAAKNSNNAKIFEDPEMAGKPNPYYQPIEGVENHSEERVYKMDPKTGKMILVSGSEDKGAWATAMDLATPDMAKDAVAGQMEGAFAKPQGPSPQELAMVRAAKDQQMAHQIQVLQDLVGKLTQANGKKLPPKQF